MSRNRNYNPYSQIPSKDYDTTRPIPAPIGSMMRRYSDPMDSLNNLKRHSEEIECLRDAVFENHIDPSYDNGHILAADGNILIDSTYGGIIPGIALATNPRNNDVIGAHAMVVPTAGNGFRYAAIGPNGSLKDIGPVENPVIVGDLNVPSAMLVPFGSKEAINQAIDILIDISTVYDDAREEVMSGMRQDPKPAFKSNYNPYRKDNKCKNSSNPACSRNCSCCDYDDDMEDDDLPF